VSNDGRVRENGYRAFISYSHRDDAAARSLHKRLETYRLPKKLIGQSGERGPIPERLTPIFRDLDELSAADDLTVEIKAALSRSATLIVLCSPGAKASKWVNLEIETFRALHGNSRPVLAALIEGEPTDAFPPALIADGQEPVAADFRKNRDGKSLALLKLVAGMAGAPLDALVQRDAQRQYRRVMAITGGALTAALAMALLLVVALRAQSEAERQRQEAEGLVEYMLTDLRDKLKGVGRLDVMTAVNERAMKYYGGQEALEGLPAESLERRARILHAMGEDDEKRGDLGLALKKFEEARRTTSAVLAKRPEDTDAIFSHAQSEFWVGSVAYQKQDRKRAYEHFERYVELAGLLNKIDPGNPDWFRELSYANGNICAVSLDKPVDSARANQYCAQALKIAERIHLTFPSSIQSYKDLINGYGWMATTYQESGKIKYSIGLRQKQEKILQEIFSKNPEDRSIIAINMKMKVAFSDALIIDKNFEEAKNKYDDAYSSYIKLITTDKSNNSWLIWEKRLKSIDNSLKDHFNG
jgi:tetratricopeptide (TPR) repeat protein